jgi:hypothetical protein
MSAAIAGAAGRQRLSLGGSNRMLPAPLKGRVFPVGWVASLVWGVPTRLAPAEAAEQQDSGLSRSRSAGVPILGSCNHSV